MWQCCLESVDVSEQAEGKAADPAVDLRALRTVVDGPLVEIAGRFSGYLSDRWPHSALVIFTRECTGRPRKVAGAPEVIERVTVEELETLKSAVQPGSAIGVDAQFAGGRRWVWAIREESETLLVLLPRGRTELAGSSQLLAAFGIVATSIRQQVAQASPDYLAESRAASSERARTSAELTAVHEAALAGVLATLRSALLDDRQARASAAEAASTALIALRSRQASDRALSEEESQAAFKRLRREIGPLLRHQDVIAEFVAPRAEGRPLPGEIACGARALTHAVVIALIAQPDARRVRVAWSCDADSLLVDIRDQAGGGVDSAGLRRDLDGRVRTLHAVLGIEVVKGWGTGVTIQLPLDPPLPNPEQSALASLNRREREVLTLLAAGKRNKSIAQLLGVAESTVKFHVAGVLRKLEVSTRGEAAVVGLRAGLSMPGTDRHRADAGVRVLGG